MKRKTRKVSPKKHKTIQRRRVRTQARGGKGPGSARRVKSRAGGLKPRTRRLRLKGKKRSQAKVTNRRSPVINRKSSKKTSTKERHVEGVALAPDGKSLVSRHTTMKGNRIVKVWGMDRNAWAAKLTGMEFLKLVDEYAKHVYPSMSKADAWKFTRGLTAEELSLGIVDELFGDRKLVTKQKEEAAKRQAKSDAVTNQQQPKVTINKEALRNLMPESQRKNSHRKYMTRSFSCTPEEAAAIDQFRGHKTISMFIMDAVREALKGAVPA